MGYERNHAIVVSSWDDIIVKAHAEALRIYANEGNYPWSRTVSPIIPGIINDWHTFIVVPDGSKEGWDVSDEGDRRRDEFIEWLDAQRYDDDSTSIDWVEVQYGDDNDETLTLRDSDARRRARYP